VQRYKKYFTRASIFRKKIKKMHYYVIILRIFLRISKKSCNFARFFDGRVCCARTGSTKFNKKGIVEELSTLSKAAFLRSTFY